MVFQEGDIIMKQGDHGDCMYILNRGEVEVLVDGIDHPVATLKDGAVFGEIAVLTPNPRAAKRSSTIRAITLCDSRVITRECLGQTLVRFPEDRAMIEAEGQRRLDELRAKGALRDKKRWYELGPELKRDAEGSGALDKARGALMKWQQNRRKSAIEAVERWRRASAEVLFADRESASPLPAVTLPHRRPSAAAHISLSPKASRRSLLSTGSPGSPLSPASPRSPRTFVPDSPRSELSVGQLAGRSRTWEQGLVPKEPSDPVAGAAIRSEGAAEIPDVGPREPSDPAAGSAMQLQTSCRGILPAASQASSDKSLPLALGEVEGAAEGRSAAPAASATQLRLQAEALVQPPCSVAKGGLLSPLHARPSPPTSPRASETGTLAAATPAAVLPLRSLNSSASPSTARRPCSGSPRSLNRSRRLPDTSMPLYPPMPERALKGAARVASPRACLDDLPIQIVDVGHLSRGTVASRQRNRIIKYLNRSAAVGQPVGLVQ